MMIRTFTNLLTLRKNDNNGIFFVKGDSCDRVVPFSELYQQSRTMLSYLQSTGLHAGDELIIVVGDPHSFLISFWACILGGIIAVPVSAGRSREQNVKLKNIWELLNSPNLLIADKDLQTVTRSLEGDEFHNILSNAIGFEDYEKSSARGVIHEASAEDIFYIQFSSGSTSLPKGVTLTHHNVLTNCRAILKGIKHPEDGDLFFSWMPLTHDMGLIGYHLTPLLAGWTHFIMPTELFIRRPALWLNTISNHKITFTASPNFGYQYVLNYVKEQDMKNIDLSSLRVITNGAEPISTSVCEEFNLKMSNYGLSSKAIFPVYGLAEASLAVTFSNPDDAVKSIKVHRNSLGKGQKVRETNVENEMISVVNLGKPLAHNCEVRIMLDSGELAAEKVVGSIHIKGENVTSEYYNNKVATLKTITNDHWLDTGDLGFFFEGCLFVTGRSKDIIFVNGQNYYPHDVEKVLIEYPGVRDGKVAVGGVFNSQKEQEEVIVFVDYRGKPEKFTSQFAELKAFVSNKIGFEPDYVIPVRDIPKTTSGKLQRYKLINQYIEGQYNQVLDTYDFSRQTTSEASMDLNDQETQIAEIWKEVLDIKMFDPDKTFFELGGNSLKAAIMLGRVRDQFLKDIGFEELFANSKLKSFEKLLHETKVKEITTIPIAAKKPFYPLSSAQLRLYYLWKKEPESIAYNVPVAFKANVGVDKDKLVKSVNDLIQRHALLRASFEIVDGVPKLQLKENVEVDIEVVELDQDDAPEYLQKSVRKFDLKNDPLFRIQLLNVKGAEQILFMDFHHIICDGQSVAIVANELINLYEGKKLSVRAVDFVDYAVWESSDFKTSQESHDFWKGHIGDNVPVLNLPYDYSRPKLFDYIGSTCEFELEQGTFEKVNHFALKNDVTPFMLFLSAYFITLSKYSGQEDIVVGVPVWGRSQSALESVFGMFVNNVAIRSEPVGSKSIRQFLHDIRQIVLESHKHQHYPFHELVDRVSTRNEPSRNVLFDTMFLYQNMDQTLLRGELIELKRFNIETGCSKYDISLEIFEGEDKFHVEYSKSLFNETTIEQFAELYQNTLKQFLTDLSIPIADVSITNESFKPIDASYYPKEICIHQLIEKQCESQETKAAIVDQGQVMTYSELNKRVSKAASFLKKSGLKRNDVVGVLMDRSTDMIVAVLGILKIGGCFIPIAPNTPVKRITHILKDSGAKLLIAEDQYLNDEHGLDEYLKIAEPKNLQSSVVDISIQDVGYSTDPCYIIYTSGTTGKPKGSVISHQSLVNYVWWASETYLKNSKDLNFAFHTSISFDLTITSIFTPLISGNTIHVYRDTEEMMSLESVLKDNRVEVIKVTPSHLRLLENSNWIRADHKLKKVIVGGENLTVDLSESIIEMLGDKVDIYNEYGPTEATVGCIYHKYNKGVDQSHSVPIGRPINNTRVYLLDKYMKAVPSGAVGELYIGGDCLSSGYINNPDLSDQKFISDPYVLGERLYKTGDLGKQLSNGNYEYLGRIDNQIKLNGYRIELTEIETQLRNHKDVSDAIVTVEESGSGQINAYIIADVKSTGSDVDIISVLRKDLYQCLPDYMIPRSFTFMDRIPLTQNGKIDYRALPKPNINTDYTPANNDIQKRIIQVWKDVLGVEIIGVDTVFFEVGGDSIKAVQISSRLEALGIIASVKNILSYPTVEQLCYHIHLSDFSNKYDQSTISGERTFTPIESWFFNQNFSNPNHYNQSVLLKCQQIMDKEKLTESFQLLLSHHDGLRLNFNDENKTMFFNEKHLTKTHAVDQFIAVSQKEFEEIGTTIKRSFNISNSLLVRLALIVDNKGIEHLLFTAHHLVVDGISWRIILEDFYQIYSDLLKDNEPQLMPKTASQIYWVDKMQLYKENIALSESEYWKEISQYRNKFLMKKNSFDKEQYAVGYLNHNMTKSFLSEANEKYRTDSLVLLLSALVLTLKNVVLSQRLVVELENHGRHIPDINVSRTVGWFTAIHPIILEWQYSDFNSLIIGVKEALSQIPNKGIGYGVLNYLDAIIPIKDDGSVRFNYLGQFGDELNNDIFCFDHSDSGFDVDPQNHKGSTIEVNAMVIRGQLKVEFVIGNSNLDAIELKDKYMEGLSSILEHIRNEENVHFSASDFDTVELDEEDFKALFD